MIKGIEKLTKEQRTVLLNTNNLQRDCVESPALKRELELVETWVNDEGIVCGRVKNGNWYHYKNGAWY